MPLAYSPIVYFRGDDGLVTKLKEDRTAGVWAFKSGGPSGRTSYQCMVCLAVRSNEIYAQRCAEEHCHFFNMKDLVQCPLCPGPVALNKACLNMHFQVRLHLNEKRPKFKKIIVSILKTQEAHADLNKGVCVECMEMVDMSANDEGLRRHILESHNHTKDAPSFMCTQCARSFRWQW